MAIDSFSQHCRQEADTAALAQRFSEGLSQYLINNPSSHLNIALEGELGAGKTTFARYLIQGMGYVGRVKSPTYTLCEPYPLPLEARATDTKIGLTAHHFDLYRLHSPLEWQEAGFAEYFDVPGFCLIEWPEKAEGSLPQFDIQIELKPGHQEEERDIILTSCSTSGAQVLANLMPTSS